MALTDHGIHTTFNSYDSMKRHGGPTAREKSHDFARCHLLLKGASEKPRIFGGFVHIIRGRIRSYLFLPKIHGGAISYNQMNQSRRIINISRRVSDDVNESGIQSMINPMNFMIPV